MSQAALKRICALVTDPGPDEERKTVALEHIVGGTGRIAAGAELPRRRPAAGLAAVEPGDVLFGKLRPYLAKTLRVREPMFASTELLALRPAPGVDSRWLHYLLMGDQIVRWAVASSEGSKMPRTSWSALGGCRVTVPEPRSQGAIADFLDAEAARIDALTAKKRRLDEVVRLRVSTAVGAATTEGKPTQVRRLIKLRTSGPRGWAERVVPSGVPFVRSANLQADSLGIKWNNMAFVEDTRAPEAERSRVRAGDVLVGITGANTGWVGFAESRHAGGFVSQHVGLLRPEGVNPKWLAYSVSSPTAREQLLGGQYGGTKQQLSLDELAELRVHAPPPKRQEELVASLDRQVDVADSLRDKLRRQIVLLAEHRQALITAAVTGQLEITGAAA